MLGAEVRRLPVRYALFVLAFAVGTVPAWGATYYASPTGSGSTCSAAAPCSLSGCVAKIAANGDVCSAGDGIYIDPGTIIAARACGTGTGVCTITATNPLGARIDVSGGTGEIFRINGNNWVLNGFLVRAQSARQIAVVYASQGFAFTNNRVEVKPGFGSEVLWVRGTDDVLVRGNWVHHYPHCIDGNQTYPAGPWGAGATAPSCGTNARCDFNTLDGPMWLFEGDGTTIATRNYTFEQNDYGHWQNPFHIKNIVNLIFRRNTCTNATNHGCVEADDVQGILIENNIADIDTGTGCNNEILQSKLYDSYCSTDVIIRNNTSVGHGMGWEQQLVGLASNGGAYSTCSTTENGGTPFLPNVVADGTAYDYMRVYNNIIYNGKPSSAAGGIIFRSAQSGTAQPCCYSDYNIINTPSGNRAGGNNSNLYVSLADWQNAPDADGDGIFWDRNSRSTAPQFVSYCNTIGTPGCHDYHPASASAPQVNAGIGTTARPCPTEDFAGNPRTDGACDIGAHEYQGTTTSPPPNVTNAVRTDKH
jgi:hypothetical protein